MKQRKENYEEWLYLKLRCFIGIGKETIVKFFCKIYILWIWKKDSVVLHNSMFKVTTIKKYMSPIHKDAKIYANLFSFIINWKILLLLLHFIQINNITLVIHQMINIRVYIHASKNQYLKNPILNLTSSYIRCTFWNGVTFATVDLCL